MVLCRSRPADSRGEGGWRSEEQDTFFFFSSSSSSVEVGVSWLNLALELAVVPRYPSRGPPCWTADARLLLWANRVLEVTSDWPKKQKVRNLKLTTD